MSNVYPQWAFPVARFSVNFVYYALLIVAVTFTLLSVSKVLGVWSNESGGSTNDHPNYVEISVKTSPPQLETEDLMDGKPFYYKPTKTEGKLAVPISSTAGLLHTLLIMLSIGISLPTFYLLRQIFKTSRAENPFHPANARRISIIGFLFLAQSLLSFIGEIILWYQARHYFAQMNFKNPSFDPVFVFYGPWLLGFILLALAEVYRRGITLQQESELTV